jgi:uncharacterized protein YaaQ
VSRLLIGIVHRDDAGPLAEALRDAGHRFTHLASQGGFLGEENATFVLGVAKADEAEVLAIIERVCRPRDVDVPLVLLERLQDWKARVVVHGGATVLIADLARIVRL